jgi:hypothetical protein
MDQIMEETINIEHIINNSNYMPSYMFQKLFECLFHCTKCIFHNWPPFLMFAIV